MAPVARGPVAALCLLLCLSGATILSHAQDTAKLLSQIEKAEELQGKGESENATVISDVVESAGSAELAR